MLVDIIIPSFRRPNKLNRLLASINHQSHREFRCYIIVNGQDQETFNLSSNYNKAQFQFIMPPTNLYTVKAWNAYFKQVYKQNKPDCVALIVDDVELYPNALEIAMDEMYDSFQVYDGKKMRYDGVVGFTQECLGYPNYTFNPCGQCLIGNEFIERYARVGYEVLAPMYTQFSIFELHEFSKSLNKFKLSEAKLKHYHPSFNKEWVDQAHTEVRDEIKKRDFQIKKLREAKGLTWPTNPRATYE